MEQILKIIERVKQVISLNDRARKCVEAREENNVIFLSGIVPTYYAKQQVESDVLAVLRNNTSFSLQSGIQVGGGFQIKEDMSLS